MKENLKLGAILLLITSIAGFLLGFANDATREAIIENSRISKEDLKLILPAASSIKESKVEGNESITEVYEALNDGNESVGHVFKITTKGFHGPVDLVIAISKDDKVSGMKVLSHSETPGLGAKITEPKFGSQIKDLPIEEDIEIVKVAPSKDNQVEGVSGASVSSKAVGTAINDVIRFYKENIKGEAVAPKEEVDTTTSASQ
ncbi:RnfABCDGE type electron transport complex subunit G [Clostridium paraputrificum]|uniref:RnfABCDGE type electron transport complex subunit G n=1 Tax=Clostridium paraputrificum TaxID=29363 RepID=UPI003D33011E